jgi:hypothetical protein
VLDPLRADEGGLVPQRVVAVAEASGETPDRNGFGNLASQGVVTEGAAGGGVLVADQITGGIVAETVAAAIGVAGLYQAVCGVVVVGCDLALGIGQAVRLTSTIPGHG